MLQNRTHASSTPPMRFGTEPRGEGPSGSNVNRCAGIRRVRASFSDAHAHTPSTSPPRSYSREAECPCLREPASAMHSAHFTSAYLYTAPPPSDGVNPLGCRTGLSACLSGPERFVSIPAHPACLPCCGDASKAVAVILRGWVPDFVNMAACPDSTLKSKPRRHARLKPQPHCSPRSSDSNQRPWKSHPCHDPHARHPGDRPANKTPHAGNASSPWSIPTCFASQKLVFSFSLDRTPGVIWTGSPLPTRYLYRPRSRCSGALEDFKETSRCPGPGPPCPRFHCCQVPGDGVPLGITSDVSMTLCGPLFCERKVAVGSYSYTAGTW